MTLTPTTAPLAELLIWQPAACTPDDSTTVLTHYPVTADSELNEPVWPGYLLCDKGPWFTAEGIPIPPPAHWADMPAGPQTTDEPPPTPAENLADVARQLVAYASSVGLVLTIEQRPLQPLAQGHFETVVSVREARPYPANTLQA
jgi:hypothetical protein